MTAQSEPNVFEKKGNAMKNDRYCWMICFSSTMIMICTMGFCNNVFPVYLPYIEENGLTGAQGSGLISIRCLFGIIGMLLAERFYYVLSLRRGLTLTCVITSGAFWIYSIANSVWTYNIAAAVSGICYGLGSMIPIGILIRNWFNKDRGIAIGICADGSGISMIIFPSILTFLVENVGLATAFRSQALFALAIAALTLGVIRDTPAEKALLPYGGSDNSVCCPSTQKSALTRVPSGHSMKTMLWVCFFVGAVAVAAPGHYSAFFTLLGYSMRRVSFAISAFGIALTLGKLVCGRQFDKIGGRNAAMLFFTLALVGCALCCMADGKNSLPMLGGVILMGVGLAPATIGPPAWAADHAESSRYSATLKWFQVSYATGGMLFSLLSGVIFDNSGSYLLAYILFLLLLGLILLGLLLAYRVRNC